MALHLEHSLSSHIVETDLVSASDDVSGSLNPTSHQLDTRRETAVSPWDSTRGVLTLHTDNRVDKS